MEAFGEQYRSYMHRTKRLLPFILLSRGLTNCWSQPQTGAMTSSQHVYEIRSRKDHRGVDLISDALP